LTEKIPYLKELGVTAVELMPVFEFDEFDNPRSDPTTGQRLHNVWGYHPLSFFAPHLTYAGTTSCRAALRELKRTVKAFHAEGMEVILDAVFNHTGEARRGEAISSLRGIDNSVYYMLEPLTGDDRNYSGCGNTLNCNHPVVRNLILDCLRYWVTEMHIDGVRFDLASILGRGTDGSVLSKPPLLEDIASDPVLAKTKLIAEAWDAAGLYQVGEFTAGGRWAEWNGKFRDDVRRFVRGDAGMVSQLATRLAGSADLFQDGGRSPFHSVNFVTCHDGFTLADLVSYNRKHNTKNGEDCHDGADENFSWNCGVEGPTNDPQITQLRRRQQRNIATLLMVSHGVPMLLYGDEAGRTQFGNNNAYCQDGAIGQLKWNTDEHDEALSKFFRKLIAFRRNHRCLRRGSYVAQPHQPYVQLEWHGTRLNAPDWSHASRSLALQVLDHDEHGAVVDRIFVIANAFWERLSFELPQTVGWHWARFVDTSLEPSSDAEGNGGEVDLPFQGSYAIEPRSTVVLVGKRNTE
jgi:glycogen operon protein